MTKTLLITNSYDATSDLLVDALGSKKVFRLNYDLISSYEIKFTADDFFVSSAVHNVSQNEIVKVFWRKAFSGQEEFEKNIGNYSAAEYKYLFREIANFFYSKGMFVLNRFDAELRFGKIMQNKIASKYFSISYFELFQSHEIKIAPLNSIIKSLSGTPLNNGNVIYTTDVSNKKLSSNNLWYRQDLIEAEYDVTVVYVYGNIYSFKLERKKFDGLDWRKDVFKMSKQWKKYKISSVHSNKICSYMKEIDWPFGRLDFLLQKDGDLVFLEVNPNGQWGWLDSDQNNGLFDKIMNCIDPHQSMPVII